MPRPKLILALAALLLSSLACVTLLGEESKPEVSPPIPDLQFPPTPVLLASCPVITDRIVDANTNIELASEFAKDFDEAEAEEEEDVTYLVTYLVSGEEIVEPFLEPVPADLKDEQEDTALHHRLWDYYTALIPSDQRATLAEFTVMTDGRENILAAVSQTYDDPNLWVLQVDIADSDDYFYLTFTLIHEFAHLLTLGPDQVPPSIAIFNNPEDNDLYLEEASACVTFFPGEGCSNPDSYINDFYEAFWADLYEEWNEINLIEDEDEYYEALDEFYFAYEDQFLTDYSVTHPAEDIAEAFGFFVFAAEPDGDSIAEQKVLFFYDYPELVELRERILANTCANFPQ
jgi:hypothetical protein